MPPTYHNSNVEVIAGDHIEFQSRLFFFLRGWIAGRVHYISHHSLEPGAQENSEFAWVSIRYGRGRRISELLAPETRQLHRTIRFVKRSDDEFVKTPQDYCFGD
jgi:hypothetical protein